MLVSEGGSRALTGSSRATSRSPSATRSSEARDFIEPGAYHHIDGSLYSEGDDAWLVLHNDLYAKFRDDMEDIVPRTNLPTFRADAVLSASRISKARTCSSTGASTTCSTPRGTVRPSMPTAARATPTIRPPRAVCSTSTTRSSPSRTTSRAVLRAVDRRCRRRTQQLLRGPRRPTVGDVLPEPELRRLVRTRHASPMPPCPVSCGSNGPAEGRSSVRRAPRARARCSLIDRPEPGPAAPNVRRLAARPFSAAGPPTPWPRGRSAWRVSSSARASSVSLLVATRTWGREYATQKRLPGDTVTPRAARVTSADASSATGTQSISRPGSRWARPGRRAARRDRAFAVRSGRRRPGRSGSRRRR